MRQVSAEFHGGPMHGEVRQFEAGLPLYVEVALFDSKPLSQMIVESLADPFAPVRIRKGLYERRVYPGSPGLSFYSWRGDVERTNTPVDGQADAREGGPTDTDATPRARMTERSLTA